jgi:hypothetical protein
LKKDDLKSRNRKIAVTNQITTAYGCKILFNWTLMKENKSLESRLQAELLGYPNLAA